MLGLKKSETYSRKSPQKTLEKETPTPFPEMLENSHLKTPDFLCEQSLKVEVRTGVPRSPEITPAQSYLAEAGFLKMVGARSLNLNEFSPKTVGARF